MPATAIAVQEDVASENLGVATAHRHGPRWPEYCPNQLVAASKQM